MLRPSMSQILKPGESYYEFVVAVARKAREIASDAEEEHFCLEEKPVSIEGPVGLQTLEENGGEAPEEG